MSASQKSQLWQEFKSGHLAGYEEAISTFQVSTSEELEALPVGSVVIDRHGYPWHKGWRDGSGSWACTSDGGETEPHKVAPLTVVYEPGSGARVVLALGREGA